MKRDRFSSELNCYEKHYFRICSLAFANIFSCLLKVREVYSFSSRAITTQHFRAKPTDRKTTSKREESEEMLALLAG